MANDDDGSNVIDLSTRTKGKPESQADPDGMERKPRDYSDQFILSTHVNVEGIRFGDMIVSAKRLAVPLLQVPYEHLYVMHHGVPHVQTRSRFEEPARPTTWAMSVTVGVIPEEAREPEPEPPPPPAKKRRAAKPRSAATARKTTS